MINLAQKDIAHSLVKFIVTSMGVGMLLGIVMIMIGVYRGMIIDAQILIDDISPDLWIVQQNTLGPFAEASRVHNDLKYSIKVLDGIDRVGALTFQNMQLPTPKGDIKVVALGYDPLGEFNPVNKERIIKGRALKQEHYEMVVSDKTGLKLGDKVKLGRDFYRVVGITHGTVSSGGDPLIYLSLKDAQNLQFLYPNWRIHSDRARGLSGNMPDLVNCIVATLKSGYSIEKDKKFFPKRCIYPKRAKRDTHKKSY